MSQASTNLGEAVIKVRADLSALPGDLAAARKMADEATAARVNVGKDQPGGPSGTTSAVDSASKAVDESTKTLDDHRKKVDEVSDATGRMANEKRNAREPVQQFTQSIRSQISALTGLVATLGAVVAGFAAAAKVAYEFTMRSIHDQANIRMLDDQYKKAAQSIESFNQARERTTAQRFPFPQTAFNNIQAVGERLSQSTTEEFDTAKSLREFEESGLRQAARGWDMAMSSVGLPGFATGQQAEFEKRKFEAENAATRRRFAAEQFQGMNERLYGRNEESGQQVDHLIKIADETTVQTQIQGELLKSQRFSEVTKPR